MIPLTKEEKKIHREQKVCYICKKGFSTDDDDNKKYYKVRDYCHYPGKYRRAAHDICNLRYKTPKEIPVVFHNGSTFDNYYTIKELTEEFEGLNVLEKTQKNILLFQYQLKKDSTMANQLHTQKSLLIALDICQDHYQVFLIIHLKDFIVISAHIVNLFLII